MDPNSPVVKLCAAGMQAETHGRSDEAHALFMQAWAARTDDFDACIAAHYIARHQTSPQDTLHWNQTALDAAIALKDDRVQSFYPSLYLNMGWSHEMLGELAEALRYYELAAGGLAELPDTPYTTVVRNGIAEGLKRINAAGAPTHT